MHPHALRAIIPCLLGAFAVLSGISECAAPDEDGDGFTSDDGDCNDQNALIFPSAPELCDGLDNNCNLEIDEGFTKSWFKDTDGDGFGDDFVTSCAATTGYVASRGDCQDKDPTSYPGAPDSLGDGLDQDCGGSDGPQPHFALNSRSSTSLQAALNAAPAGSIVWVGPGSFVVTDLHFPPQPLSLRSTQLASKTRLDAQYKGRVVLIESGQTTSTLLDGFTLSHGKISGNNGGCLWIQNASPHLLNLIVEDCQAINLDPYQYLTGDGGGIFLENSSAVLEYTTVRNNMAYQTGVTTCQGVSCSYAVGGGWGGGISVYGGAPQFDWLLVEGNSVVEADGYDAASGGGGIDVYMGTLTLSNSTLQNNEAARGAGLRVLQGSLLVQASFLLNNAVQDSEVVGAGGGIYSTDSTLNVLNTTIQNNRSDVGGGVYAISTLLHMADCKLLGNGREYNGDGGGLLLSNVNLTDATYSAGLERLLIAENRARNGGGLWLSGSSQFTVSQLTIVNNMAMRGGGVYLYDGSSPQFRNSIISDNQAWNLFNDELFPGNPTFTNTILHNPSGTNHNLGSLGPGAMDVEPEFVASSRDQNADNDDFHLRPGSPAIDAGQNGTTDLDGTRADLGFYGDSSYDLAYYRDFDDDGLYDGWENRFWGKAATQTDADDSDGDGLVNGVELTLSTRPDRIDTDGDGVSDAMEQSSSSDPLDWYLRPIGSPGTDALGRATAHVPTDFPTLDEALHAARLWADIRLAPGEYIGKFAALGLTVNIQGTGLPEDSILKPPAECLNSALPYCYTAPMLTVGLSTATLSSLTVTSGRGPNGGNLSIVDSAATLGNIVSSNGAAQLGGGLYADGSDLTVTGSSFGNNCAESYGGGVRIEDGRLVLLDSDLSHNSAYLGSALFLGVDVPDATISGTTFADNLDPALLSDDTNTGDGTIYAKSCLGQECDLNISNIVMRRNSMGGTAGITLYRNATISNSLFHDNTGEPAVLYMESSKSILQNVTLLNNHATSRYSGIIIKSPSTNTLDIRDSILAYSPGYLLYAWYYDGQSAPRITVSNTTLYDPGSSPTHNLSTVPTGLWSVEPGFLSYDANGDPTSSHLALTSPLINQGSGSGLDLDGSKPDLGVYGGHLGGSLDQDLDGYPDYFWPGSFNNAPAGTNSSLFDRNDTNAAQH